MKCEEELQALIAMVWGPYKSSKARIKPYVILLENGETWAFNMWRLRVLSYLVRYLGADHLYTREFSVGVSEARLHDYLTGLGILEALQKDLCDGVIEVYEPPQSKPYGMTVGTLSVSSATKVFRTVDDGNEQ